MQRPDIIRHTWSSPTTVIHHIYMGPKPADNLEAIFIWKKNTNQTLLQNGAISYLCNFFAKCNKISWRGGKRHPVWKFKGSRPPSLRPRVNGPPTTENPSPKRQLHHYKHRKQNNSLETLQIYWHAFLMAQRLCAPGPIPRVLAPRTDIIIRVSY